MADLELGFRPTFKVDLSSSSVGSIDPNTGLPTGQNANNFTANFNTPIKLTGPYEVAMTAYSIWYTINNISEANGTNKFRYAMTPTPGGGDWKTITLPDGNYNVGDINTEVKAGIAANGDNPDNITITGLAYLYRALMNVFYDDGTPTNSWSVDFADPTTIGLAGILGFNQAVYSATSLNGGVFLAQNQANITNGFSAFVFSSPNTVNPTTSYNSRGPSSSLLQDTFTVPPGYNQGVSITWPKFVPVMRNFYNSITIQVTDQNGKYLDFGQDGNYQNNALTVTLLFRPIYTNPSVTQIRAGT